MFRTDDPYRPRGIHWVVAIVVGVLSVSNWWWS